MLLIDKKKEGKRENARMYQNINSINVFKLTAHSVTFNFEKSIFKTFTDDKKKLKAKY